MGILTSVELYSESIVNDSTGNGQLFRALMTAQNARVVADSKLDGASSDSSKREIVTDLRFLNAGSAFEREMIS